MWLITNKLDICLILIIVGFVSIRRKRLNKYIFYSSFSLLTFAAKK